MSKISDFKIAASLLRELSKQRKRAFTDMAVVFLDGQPGLTHGGLNVGKPKSIGMTLYLIVQTYVNAYKDLFTDDREKNDFLIYVATLLRRATMLDNSLQWDESKNEEIFLQRLYQRQLVWSLMKNLICPIYGSAPKNVLLVVGTSPFIDAACYFKEGEVTDPHAPKDAFIFVNEDVRNEAFRNAVLFYEALKAHDLSLLQVVNDLFESRLYEKFLGILKLGLVGNEQVEEFVAVLFSLAGVNASLYPHVEQQDGKVVVAQASSSPQTAALQWWYQGLTEKMLEPVRGFDWSVRVNLNGHLQELWDQVEKIKSRKRQGDGVSFNELLRLKQMQTTDRMDVSQTIQALLSQQRIWQ